MTSVLGWAALLVGMGSTALGFVLPDRVHPPWHLIVPWLAPAGLLLALVGLLTVCVPQFFLPPDEPAAAHSATSLEYPIPGGSR